MAQWLEITGLEDPVSFVTYQAEKAAEENQVLKKYHRTQWKKIAIKRKKYGTTVTSHRN